MAEAEKRESDRCDTLYIACKCARPVAILRRSTAEVNFALCDFRKAAIREWRVADLERRKALEEAAAARGDTDFAKSINAWEARTPRRVTPELLCGDKRVADEARGPSGQT